MRLIGAGLPRTATLSQKVALEMLGVGPCYHMVDVLGDLDRVPPWARALEGAGNWSEVFEGYQATVDWPGAFFYRELMDVYPDAKVLLSVRSGDDWARSMEETICGVLSGDSLIHDLSSARCRVDAKWRGFIELVEAMWEKSGLLNSTDGNGSSSLASSMRRYNEEVQRTVPADRLLVWTASEGWEPLCDFLGIAVPEQPFPRVNDSAMFADRIVESALGSLTAWHAEQVAAASA